MFIYFIEKEKRPQPPLVGALAHLMGGLVASRGGLGPGQVSGLLLTLGEVPEYKPEAQDWRKIPGSNSWVGLSKAGAKPTPDQLVRSTTRSGTWVKLADGRPWLVPVARMVVENGLAAECQLPRKLELGEDGRWGYGPVVPEFAALWAACEGWYDKKVAVLGHLAGAADGRVEFDLQAELAAAVLALATNYHLGPVECDMLGLFDERAVMAVLDGLCDLLSFDVLTGKKAVAAEAGQPPAA